MQLIGPPTGSMFSCKSDNKLLGGDVPSDEKFAFATIQSSENARLRDDRFKDLKQVIRDLYQEPPNQPKYTKEQLEELWASMDELKVYPHNDQSTVQILPPATTFEMAYGHNPSIMAEIKKNGFPKPTSIQCQMWPTLLSGVDCVGVSQTGSGKTLAFLLPAFLHIDAQYKHYSPSEKKPNPSVLVLTPTRELALQIEREVEKYSYNGYKSVCVYGGAPRNEQIGICQQGVEIVIATPGRLADLSALGVIDLASVSYVVLDEADRMLEDGFEPSIKRIMFEVRPDRLVALTSATWPESVRELTRRYTKDAVMVVVGTLDLSSCKTVKQYVEFIDENDKFERTCEIVHYLDQTQGGSYKLIIFVKAKILADHLSSQFCLKNINSEGLHGGRSQTDRENSLANFRVGKVKILVATDLASRGIDIPDITHVINYDFPSEIEEYVHRVGRTGRAGKSGNAMSFMTYRDRFLAADLISILEKSGQDVDEKLRYMAKRHAERMANRPPGMTRGRNRREKSGFHNSY